jgi:hypothetical protein
MLRRAAPTILILCKGLAKYQVQGFCSKRKIIPADKKISYILYQSEIQNIEIF